MATTQFYIRPTAGAPETKVYIKIRIRQKSVQTEIRQAIPDLVVDVRKWRGLTEDGKSSPRIRKNYEKLDGKVVFDKLRKIEDAINLELYSRPAQLNADKVRDIVDQIVHKEEYERRAEQEKQELELERIRREEDTRRREEAKKVQLMDYYLRFIERKKKVVAKRTATNYMQGYNRLMDYQADRRIRLDWKDLDRDFFDDYNEFLCNMPDGKNRRGAYNDATRHKRWTELRTIVRSAREEGITDCIFDTYSYASVEETQTPENQVYLTRGEVDKMLDVDLSGMPKGYTEARDLFMVGILTAQRISDYNNIQPADIIKGEDGRTYIQFVQKKTKKRITVPANSELRAILAKYKNRLPHLSDQRINHHLHEICKLAGLNDPVKTTSTKGGGRKEVLVEKYKLISSHTARRTGATLMYLSGMDELDICRITGHESAKMLRRYILADELDVVKTIAGKYDYFD